MFDSRSLANLSDKELEDLHGNAIRLAQSGDPAQRAEAERLLPDIGREIADRSRTRTNLTRSSTAPPADPSGATAEPSTGIRLPTKP